MPLHILLIHRHSAHNAGDAALTDLTLAQLKQQFPGSELTLAVNDLVSHTGPEPVVASFRTWFKDITTHRYRWWAVPGLLLAALWVAGLYRLTGRAWLFFVPPARRALLQAYLSADLVVSGPGGYLYGVKNGLGLVNALFTILYGWLVGKPVYLLPQTIGPFTAGWQHHLVRWTLSRTRLIMVREPLSRRLLQQMDLPPRLCVEIPDLAFGLEPAPPAAAKAWLTAKGVPLNSGRPLLGLTVIDWGRQEPTFTGQALYEDAVEAVVRYFVQEMGGVAVFFAQVCDPSPGHDDRVPARRIVSRLADLSTQVVLIDEAAPFPLLKASYGLMDLFLGTRLHSNIFALTEGVPALAIGYQFKTLGVLTMTGLERWITDINEATPPKLVALLAELWPERLAVRQHLGQRIPRLAQQTRQMAARIAADYLK